MSGKRWLCNGCGHRFNIPAFEVVEAPLPAIAPTLTPGQHIQYKCPECGSTTLAGSANSHPLKLILCRPTRRNR